MLRITLKRADKQTVSSVVVVAANDWDALIKAANNKLRIKAKRVFTEAGAEVLTDTVGTLIKNGDTLLVSTGSEPPRAAASLAEETSKTEDGDEAGDECCTVASVRSGELTAPVRIVANAAWLEDSAITQLKATSRLPGVVLGVGMPDLHAGKGYPIGSVIATDGVIYPYAIGGDIGCGMSLLTTSIEAAEVTPKRLDKWANQVRGLDDPWTGGASTWLQESTPWPSTGPRATVTQALTQDALDAVGAEGLPKLTAFNATLGTVGRGNHFAELQAVERIVDAAEFAALGLDEHKVLLMVHSGSRGLGDAILERHANKFGAAGLRIGSTEATEYMQLHDIALQWARHNRRLIAHRILSCIGAEVTSCSVDVWHNFVCKKAVRADALLVGSHVGKDDIEWMCEHKSHSPAHAAGGDDADAKEVDVWLHRKGAAPTDTGPVVIPGSRGAFSYLVGPTTDRQQARVGWSSAHGAGRKYTRAKAQEMMRHKAGHHETLLVTDLGSRVVCADKELLYEEAPEAYKDIEEVIADLEAAGLIRVIAVLRPVLTYKTG